LFPYHFGWTLLVILSLPLFPLIKSRRLSERLGLSLTGEPLKSGSIWIHALSVGEVISAVPLVKAVKKRYPLRDIVFTVTTTHGMEIARSELRGDVKALLPMPMDFWWSIRRVINHFRPSLFIVVETDIWPGMLNRLRKMGIKSVLINGRISPRTFRSYRRFPFLIRIMLNGLELCLMQSELDRNRLLAIGIGPDKVKTVGNIKFDRDWVPMRIEEYKDWLEMLDLAQEREIWVAGSTHQGEEDIVLNAFGRLREFFPNLRLIIAPLILNTLGELDRIYGIAKISFVGGSLVSVGGHNLLEPASFGRPVLFGPHTHNFVLMSELLMEAGAGKRVRDGEELFRTMMTLLSDSEKCSLMGRRAKEFVQSSRGALDRVMEHIGLYIDAGRDASG
jgi:3-deoxy-D-manno-octulosonic-acid transferase